MRKQLAIGVSVLALTALGGVSENNFISDNQSGVHSQYTHFVRTSLNQFEPLSGASLDVGLPNRSKYQIAGVHFIVGDQGMNFGSAANNNDFSDPSGENCKRLGYSVTSCASGLFNSACPYNETIYDRCCDATYKYTSSQCSSPKTLSSDTCGGKHRCYCNTSTFPYTTCNDPQIKGNACTDDTGTRYATCTCPSGVATPYGCETFYKAPCSSVCQKAYADNCRNRTAVQTPYGCESYFSDCSSKCEKAYPDNCRNRTAVATPYGCKQTYGDCQSKCEIAYPDNCHNRTAVISSCPANATCSYFSDCSSKIQSWSCNSGYEKSGNSCVASIKSRACQYVGDILYGDGTCADDVNKLDPNKTPIGVVFDVTNRLAIALTDALEDGSVGSDFMHWSSGCCCDTPNLKNCTDESTVKTTCGIDGRANTDAILASKCNGVLYAVNAVNKYQISGCSKTFCQKGKWFLPSVKELYTIDNNKSTINNTLSSLSSIGASQMSSRFYWSSTEASGGQVWQYVMEESPWDLFQRDKSIYYSNVRPVVKY